MKTMKIITMVIFLASLFGACEKKPMDVPDPPIIEMEVFEMEWATRLDNERTIANHNNGVVYNGEYIYFGDIDEPSRIYAFDIISGNKKWEYSYEGWDDSDVQKSYSIENILICVTARRVFGFDLNSQSVIWEEDLKSQDLLRGSGTIASNGKFYLLADENFSSLLNQVQYLIEYDPVTGDRKDIVKYSRDEEGDKGISPPVYKDGILYYNLRNDSKAPPQNSPQSIVAFDIETEQELWRNDNFITEWSTNGLHPPVIYNNVVITGGDYSMYGFDIETGELLWRTPLPGYDKFGVWTNTNHLIYDGVVYVNPVGPNLMCLDAETGAIIWNTDQAPNCSDNMIYHDGMLIFASWGKGSVMILDAETGETIHQERPFEDSNFQNDVVYDEETDMFFTSTYKHAIGFKINKPE